MENKGKIVFGYFLASLLGVVVGAWLILALNHGGVLAGIMKQPSVDNTKASKSVSDQNVTTQKTAMTNVSQVAQKLMPSVVGITSTTNVKGMFSTKNTQQTGVGSGIIVDADGYILTNNHVANKTTDEIQVSLFDGREVKGKAVWADETLDLAIIKIDADNLTVATLGDSKNLTVGEQAVAIGNPLGLTFQRTVTAGIISAFNRTIADNSTFMEDLIQTDAAINEGNSGGPLINMNGEVVGVNTIKVSSAEGMGFAVPVNIVKPILKSIKEKGSFTTPVIGISGIDKQMAGLTTDVKVDQGIYVQDVQSGKPADVAGIKKGEYIIAANGKTVDTMIELKTELYGVGVGNSVSLKVKSSDGKERDVNLKLEASTPQLDSNTNNSKNNNNNSNNNNNNSKNKNTK